MAGPASLLMFKIGRQRGFMAGALLGFLGITVAGMAIVEGSFLWFCIGLVMAGGANSFVQQYRFAASDYVQDTIKSQAISRVLIEVSRLASSVHRLSCTTKIFCIQSLMRRIFEWCRTFYYRFFGDDPSNHLKFLRHERLIEKKEEQGKSLSKIKPLLLPCYVGPVATL